MVRNSRQCFLHSCRCSSHWQREGKAAPEVTPPCTSMSWLHVSSSTPSASQRSWHALTTGGTNWGTLATRIVMVEVCTVPELTVETEDDTDAATNVTAEPNTLDAEVAVLVVAALASDDDDEMVVDIDTYELGLMGTVCRSTGKASQPSSIGQRPTTCDVVESIALSSDAEAEVMYFMSQRS